MGKEREGRCSWKEGSEPSGTAGGLTRLAAVSRQKVGRRSVDGEVQVRRWWGLSLGLSLSLRQTLGWEEALRVLNRGPNVAESSSW